MTPQTLTTAGHNMTDALIAAMAGAGIYDPAHVARTVALAEAVCTRLGTSEETRDQVRRIAILHDLGKLGIPRSILDKDTPLTAEERRTLCQQPAIGAEMLRPLPELAALAPLLEATHERWDGLGYPAGLHQEEIPLASRIVFVCNAYVTMREARPYRPAMPREFALAVVEKSIGRQFCPSAGRALLAAERGEAVEPVPAAPAPAPRDGGLATIEEVRSALERQRLGRAEADRAAAREAQREADERLMEIPRSLWLFLVLAGLVVGGMMVLPLPDAHHLCGATSQGGVACRWDKIWLPAIQTVILVPVALLVLTVVALRIPRWFRLWRTGSLEVRQKLVLAETDDPVLAAASWGLVMRDARTAAAPVETTSAVRVETTGAQAFIAASQASPSRRAA